jgi:hypothetical protein
VIAECGHVVQEERPVEAGALIRKYVEELRNRSAPQPAGPKSVGKRPQADPAGLPPNGESAPS